MAELVRDLDKAQDACGVFGIYALDRALPVAQLTYLGISALQHRGEGGAGIFVGDFTPEGGFGFYGTKDKGLVPQAIPHRGVGLDHMAPDARIGVGHTRYPTSGSLGYEGAGPWRAGPTTSGIVLSHNGHIENVPAVAAHFGMYEQSEEARRLGLDAQFVSDSEGAALLLNHVSTKEGGLLPAMHAVFQHFDGAYSFIIADSNSVYAARDRFGLRPLVLGELDNGYVAASEQPALRAVGARYTRDVERGEIVQMGARGVESSHISRVADAAGICALEFVYFARSDGAIEGRNVYASRFDMGKILATECPTPEADLIVGVPDSGIPAALGYAKASGTPYALGITKNPYANGRSFIEADPELRALMVLNKLRPNSEVTRGKRLVITDDSIIRGTTMRTLIRMLRDPHNGGGAAEVHLRISSPPNKWPCFYGIDTGNPETLLARNMTIPEMAKELGADSLGFISDGGLRKAIALPSGRLCMACMTGDYPTTVPERAHKGMPARLHP